MSGQSVFESNGHQTARWTPKPARTREAIGLTLACRTFAVAPSETTQAAVSRRLQIDGTAAVSESTAVGPFQRSPRR